MSFCRARQSGSDVLRDVYQRFAEGYETADLIEARAPPASRCRSNLRCHRSSGASFERLAGARDSELVQLRKRSATVTATACRLLPARTASFNTACSAAQECADRRSRRWPFAPGSNGDAFARPTRPSSGRSIERRAGPGAVENDRTLEDVGELTNVAGHAYPTSAAIVAFETAGRGRPSRCRSRRRSARRGVGRRPRSRNGGSLIGKTLSR